jgi:hypothetical protein
MVGFLNPFVLFLCRSAMKRSLVSVAAVVWVGIVSIGVAGCGGGSISGGGGGGGTAPSITSFAASPSTIEAGSSSSLTAVFTGGTGVITPGNTSVTSGTAVSVSPTTTTPYTLTVTPTSGSAVTAMATVTVDPVPTITSFGASPGTIEAGSSSNLTAVFAGGTGVITPGNIAIVSGTPVTVSPTATTAYTLTVTPPVGTVTATGMATVTVDPVPTITGFGASPGTIEAGSSSSLTAVFSGGTGMITPGNISVVSGTPVAVSPTATTAYTLTVTPPVGSVNATMMATVTVDPVPTITSFTANPTSISSGGSSSLSAVFSGGTGVITAPGGFSQSATSGTPVSVSPTATTTYTLTVTPPVGSVNATMTATVTVGSGSANITSFTANPTTIGAGSSSSLVGYFTGGTGVITPGNLSATSGTAVSVSPTTTTTYTLTVTPTGGGTAATKTATVTVDPAPVITSFTANPMTIVAPNSTSLSASFTGGTGVITPGSLSITSGTPLTLSPTATTTYTLTVTPPVGTAATQMVTVTVETGISVNQSSSGPAVTDQLLGMNMAVWDDFTANKTAVLNAFSGAGIVALRWPGGSTSDDYHWNGTNANPANGTAPSPGTCAGAYQDSNTNYLNFINELENAGGFDVALTADYGTNPACTGGGDPNEAANWVRYAYANGGTVSHVTVGNEEYGSWEEDMHTKQHDPGTYASAVIGTSGYYDLIKAANSSTLVGVAVDANSNCCAAGWDTTVLKNAAGSYDFVEFHYYPQNPLSEGGSGENDTYLVHQAALDLTTNINTIKQELVAASEPDVPIYVGEMGSVSSNPGKQSVSITQGLYAGQTLGEMMNDGVSRATWWIGFGNCNGTAGNNSASLYGWQDWGAYNVFSDGTEDPSCPNYGSFGSLSPTAAAFDLFQHVAVNGESVLTAGVAGDSTDVRAYAATHSGGTALVLFNLNETTSETVSVSFSTETTSPGVTEYTYDKAIYDLTNTPTLEWNGPTTTALGSQTLPLTVTLAPWSMNVFIIQ